MAAPHPNPEHVLATFREHEMSQTRKQIATMVGMTPSGLSHFLRRRGLTNDHRRREFDPEVNAACEVLEMVADIGALKRIAEKLGVHESTVSSWQRRNSTPPEDALPAIWEEIGRGVSRLVAQRGETHRAHTSKRQNNGVHYMYGKTALPITIASPE